jgi:hypothetical protein
VIIQGRSQGNMLNLGIYGSVITSMITRLSRFKYNLIFLLSVSLLLIVSVLYFRTAIRSAYYPYEVLPGSFGYPYDVVPRWIGTRNLLLYGIDPYSDLGRKYIETAFYGREINTDDNVRDNRHFIYPLYTILFYAPFVHLSIHHALVATWIISFALIISTICFWFKIIYPDITFKMLIPFILFFMLWPQMWTTLLLRQPMFFSYFCLIFGVYLAIFSRHWVSLMFSGVVFFLATIRPHNSLLALIYLFSVWLPGYMGKKRIAYILIGFVGAGLISCTITYILVPHWIREFINELIYYRNYTGRTVCVRLFGNTLISQVIEFTLIAIGLYMASLGYIFRDRTINAATFAYILILQVIIFPTPLYGVLYGIPTIALVSTQLTECFRGKNMRVLCCQTLFCLATCFSVFLYWVSLILGSKSHVFVSLRNVFLEVFGLKFFNPFLSVLLLALLGTATVISEMTLKQYSLFGWQGRHHRDGPPFK